MNFSNYKFTLDMHTAQSQVSLPVVLNDTARKFYISLSDGGKSYHIADGCLALVRINRPTGTYVEHFCSIEDNTNIVYDLSQFENTAIIPGVHDCEVTLYGLEDEVITTARFTMVVSERVVNSDDVEIKDEDWTMLDEIGNEEARRQASESARNKAETLRVEAEKERVKAESERETNTAIAIEAANAVAAELLRKAEDGEFNGKDGVDGKDGYTPIKGVDYFDGKDGADGKDGIDGKDGKDGAKGDHGSGGKPVTDYGAKGDGSTDDTAAFKSALAENRIVFVPGGTYKLTSGITIGDNCCLELAQDAVLNFTNTTGNCITLGMLSNLKGNHATIKVPYEFSGNVLYAYSNTHTDAQQRAVPPFTKWDPQWKSGRYVTDVNICKADSRGFHYAVEPEDCKGAAVYLSADNTQGLLTFMWGIHYSGLRIAGAFKYGILCKNLDDGWMHEMRIDAFIDACEIGVQLEDCNQAYIAAVVQPRRAYSMGEVYAPYAKHGIKLVNSKNVDLSGSRVWDWANEDKPSTAENEKTTLWADGNEYQSYAMYGDCRGAIINDFAYYQQGDTRKRIYTDYLENFEHLTILQEPIDTWFKVRNGDPYYNDGLIDRKLVSEESLAAHFTTDLVKNFTDVLPTATDTDGTIYGKGGYKNGYLLSDGNVTESVYYTVTGFIPIKAGQTFYVNDMTFATYDGLCRISVYDANFNNIRTLGASGFLSGNDYHFGYQATANGFSATINNVVNNKDVAYVRFSVYKRNVGGYPMVAIDEPIEYTVEGFLADGVKVKGENVIGEIGVGTPDWVAKKKLVGGTEVIIPEQSVTTTWNNLNIALQPGLVYDVYVDGILYACEAWGSGKSVYLGNNTDLSKNDYPFCVYWAGGTATMGMFFGEGSTLKVTDHAYYEYDKMPEGYLPDSVVKTVNGAKPDEKGNVTVDIPEGGGNGIHIGADEPTDGSTVWVDTDEESASGGSSIDVTASVGQTIIVKEVDASGKPTKWKSAEYQPRTHWSEDGKVQVSRFPKVISAYNGDYGAFMFPIVIDKSVASEPITTIDTIEYDGVEYSNLATFSANGMTFFGNLYFLNAMFGASFANTGEPFVIAQFEEGYMYGLSTDTEATVHALQIYIEGTKYHRIDSRYRPEIPVIDLTTHTLSNEFIAISDDDYYDKVYRVLMENDMVKIIYTDGDCMHTAVAGTVRSSTGDVNVYVKTYSQAPGLMIYATDSEASVVLI